MSSDLESLSASRLESLNLAGLTLCSLFASFICPHTLCSISGTSCTQDLLTCWLVSLDTLSSLDVSECDLGAALQCEALSQDELPYLWRNLTRLIARSFADFQLFFVRCPLSLIQKTAVDCSLQSADLERLLCGKHDSISYLDVANNMIDDSVNAVFKQHPLVNLTYLDLSGLLTVPCLT